MPSKQENGLKRFLVVKGTLEACARIPWQPLKPGHVRQDQSLCKEGPRGKCMKLGGGGSPAMMETAGYWKCQDHGAPAKERYRLRREADQERMQELQAVESEERGIPSIYYSILSPRCLS